MYQIFHEIAWECMENYLNERRSLGTFPFSYWAQLETDKLYYLEKGTAYDTKWRSVTGFL